MPFAGYDDFNDCTSQNSDKQDPEAYCAAIKREVEGPDALTDEEQSHYDRLMTTGESGGRSMAQFRNPNEIRRVEKNGDTIFKRVMLLSPGVWADAGSQQHVDYSPEGIRASADNFVDINKVREVIPEWSRLSNSERADALRDHMETVRTNELTVNFLHGPGLFGADSLDSVGHIPAESIIVDDKSQLYGDIVLHGDSPQSETAIELMDEVLEAATEPGMDAPPVGPSVEIPADHVTQDEDGLLTLEEAWFSGVGIVFNPASKPVELGSQANERAVAMTSATEGEGGDETVGVVYRSDTQDDGDSLNFALRQKWRMSTDTDSDGLPEFDDMNDEELRRTLETMREDMTELEALLQD